MNVKVTSHKDEVIKEKNEAIKKALEAVGIQAQGDVVAVITQKGIVDTGRLRDSITYATAHKRGKTRKNAMPGDGVEGTPDENSVFVGTNVIYAPYHEFGTSKMNARPYLKPGIMDNINTYKEIISKFLEEE